MSTVNRQSPAASAEPLRSSETIQGNILAPFNKPHQAFLFLNFRNDQDGARQWLTVLTSDNRIATTRAVAEHNAEFRTARAAERPVPSRVWMGVGLTSSGLVTLHPELASDLTAYEAFWHGAFGGRRDQQRTQRTIPPLLNGKQAIDPAADWLIGGPHPQDPVDALLTVAADDEDELAAAAAQERVLAEDLGLAVLRVGQEWEQRGHTLPGPHGGTEHFGFKDGVSQPGVLHFTPGRRRHQRLEDADHPGSPLIATGEFVLGYRGERRSYSPVRPPSTPGWMRDGSFQVFLRLTQDVASWRAQIHGHSDNLGEDEQEVAAKVMGRRADGAPLAPDHRREGPNDFDYGDDAEGRHTPRFAHVRKVNPRLGDRSHRLLRRGIPFGPAFEPGAGGPEQDKTERGLLFNAFMASIEDQFEHVQWGWASDPADDGPDPVIGTNPASCRLRTGSGDRELTFERFVRTTGAVYAFAPSIPTLRRLGRPGSLRKD